MRPEHASYVSNYLSPLSVNRYAILERGTSGACSIFSIGLNRSAICAGLNPSFD